MKSKLLTLILLCITGWVFAQQQKLPCVETIDQAQKDGVQERVNKTYKSAINVADSTQCVFRRAEDQDRMGAAYVAFMQEFGKYLSDHKFKWGKTTKCWNRIYFGKDGSVEYYLFNFKTSILPEQLTQYKELFTAFAMTHKINMTANEGFAQCSPITYTAE